MITGHLNELRGGTDLVVTLRDDVIWHLALVELVADLLEVVLHHVDVVLIILKVDARVLDQQNAELVETFCNFLTLDSNVVRELMLLILLAL
jgi:hypothetical protein